MKMKSTLAAALLVASGVVTPPALAQGSPTKAAEAQRLQKLKAQRDADIAAARARQNTVNRTPTATPTAVPTTRPTATPSATPTTRPATSASATPSASAAATPAPSSSAAPKVAAPRGLDLEEMKATRVERRKAEFAALQARWGAELLRNEKAAAELKQHAQRTAYLQRIRALASKATDTKTVTAVDVLITKEDTRNADAMNALRSGALPAPVAGATK